MFLEPVQVSIVRKLETDVVGNPLFARQLGSSGIDPFMGFDVSIGKGNYARGTMLSRGKMIIESGKAARVNNESRMTNVPRRHVHKREQTRRVGDGEIAAFAEGPEARAEK